MAKGEYVKKSAPEFCEVTIVHDGKNVCEVEKVTEFSSPGRSSSHITRHSERNLFPCACFSGKSFSMYSLCALFHLAEVEIIFTELEFQMFFFSFETDEIVHKPR